MLSQSNPEVFEAFDVEFSEEQAQRQQMAREAWLEEMAERKARQEALIARLDARLAVWEEREYLARQDAAESYGDYLAQQAEAQAQGEEPTATDWDLSDERILRLR